MMDDTSHIESRHHRKVEMAASPDLLIVAHNAKFALPIMKTIPRQRVSELLAYLTHIFHGRIGPVAVSQNAVRHARAIAQIGLHAVFIEEAGYFETALPVCLVSTQEASQIATLIDRYLCIDLLLFKCFRNSPHQLCYFPVGSGRPFLLWSQPVPVSVRLVDRTDIVEVDAVVRFQSFQACRDEPCGTVIAVRL